MMKKNIKNMKQPLMFKKVPITILLEILNQLYKEGVDYVDIEKENIVDETSDRIKIKVLPEYYMEDEENIEDDDVNKKISLFDLDINDLI
jgi:hypothetical protein